MILEILSPENTIFKGAVEQVTLPGQKGRFTVLNLHAPIISTLSAGSVDYVPEGRDVETGKIAIPIIGGFVEVKNNVISVCVEVDPVTLKKTTTSPQEGA